MHTLSKAAGITLAGLLTLLTLAPTPSSTAAVAPATQLNPCWSSDNGQPVVDSVEASPSVVDSDAGPTQVEITVQAHDTGGPGPATGIRHVQGVLYPRSTNPDSWAGPDVLPAVFTRAVDGSWHATVTVPAHVSTTYDASVGASDKADEAGIGGPLYSPYGQRFDDVLTATARSYPEDTEPPVLEGLSLNAERVDTRKHAQVVTVDATITDNQSGVAAVTISLSGPFSKDVTVTRVDGTDHYRGQSTITRWAGDQNLELVVSLVDHAGNRLTLEPSDLKEQGFPSHVQVVSGSPNTDPPRLVSVQRAARSIDVGRHGKSYPVRLVLADPQGVAGVTVHLGYNPGAHLHRVSGSARHGVWAGRVWIPRCTYGPISTALTVYATDREGSGHRHHPREVRLVTVDNKPTRARNADGWHANPLVFTFKRPVQGVSTTNVSVLGNFHQSEVTGVWSCRDPKGHRVDCLRGPVKQARFTVDDPEDDFPGYVDWEPEHHLDVLDRLGNPVASSYDPDWG